MALRMWASSTANALRVSCASKAHVSPAFSLSRCFSSVLDGLKYATSHEWGSMKAPVATIGITDHAQDHLGEVVFVELPEPGGSVSKGNALELWKINSSPYEDGWMIKVKPGNPSELESLMGPKEYTKFCEEEDAAH
ncbi:Glycine cleavage system H protein, mitochondrial [Vitis vinifera]|uniref:Glycine cleavage system H protein, mitochondrial n=1 Tax=Vitis vinifera TaxID=29760 RepID=A0A438EQK5_VITVI|nr:Glycine cleavage system H protein, mitochondrial [Vitis vinifera]